ncbi:MAG: DUF4230 domain-containing protein [Bilifractor sp.]|jgi:hypothetical protein
MSKGSKGSKVSRVFNTIIYVAGIVAICLLVGFIVWRIAYHKGEEAGASTSSSANTQVQTNSSTSEVKVETQTQDVSFADIGELATQEVYCNEIGTSEKPAKQVFNIDVPFTSSKCIYTCGVTVKAGCNFDQIDWNEDNNVVTVKVPAMEILGAEVDNDSYAVYDEDTSVFNPIETTDVNLSFKDLKEQAREDAVKVGILIDAEENAENIIKEKFLEAGYTEANGYSIEFEVEESDNVVSASSSSE